MNISKALPLLFLLSVSTAFAEYRIPYYYSHEDFLLAPPGVLKNGLNGYVNPAVLSCVDQPDLMYTWSDQGATWDSPLKQGLFLGLPHFGFGLINEKNSLGGVTDNRISVGGGNGGINFGLGYGWSAGDTALFHRTNLVTLGLLGRPNRYLSLGIAGDLSTESTETQAIADLGVRPFGGPVLTLFSDYAAQQAGGLRRDGWSAGAIYEPFAGIRFIGRYFDDKTLTAGLNVSFGFAGVAVQGRYDTTRAHLYNTYAVEAGYDRSVFTRKDKYVKLELHDGIAYQRYLLFDGTPTLSETLALIEKAKNNDAVAGIAVNTSGFSARGISENSELLWEVREKLAEFRAAGKEVIVYLDDATISTLYFASVADRIVLDPEGTLDLRGIRYGAFFLKDTLDKLGIGFQDLRFFKYKSAFEVFSRTEMSDAEREQAARFTRNYYDVMRAGICKARKLTPAAFDALVNDGIFFLPEQAKKANLVDQVAHWESDEIQARATGKPLNRVSRNYVARTEQPMSERWGGRPLIAVLYAIGPCAMDTGINARRLVKDVEDVTDDPMVKAVVLRVDSPGGSGLAADIVASALRECARKKPVIISQGFLAASGGYWLSMYGDAIVASPLTLTGSIGVIDGWVYNKGFKERLGITTDVIKEGAHADAGFGMPVPFAGELPDRPLDEREYAVFKEDILVLYKEFVTKVAAARKKSCDDIEAVAQGRVWSGEDAKAKGLVDEMGTLDTALRLARKKIGYPEDGPIRIVELPQPGLMDLRLVTSRMTGLSLQKNPLLEYLKFRAQYNGIPMPLLPAVFFDLDARER